MFGTKSLFLCARFPLIASIASNRCSNIPYSRGTINVLFTHLAVSLIPGYYQDVANNFIEDKFLPYIIVKFP